MESKDQRFNNRVDDVRETLYILYAIEKLQIELVS